MKCRGENLPISGLPTKTQDARCSSAPATDSNEPLVATFTPGHSGQQLPDGSLAVHNAAGRVAKFDAGHKHELAPDGSLVIRADQSAYRAAETHDQASRSLGDRLRGLNLRNAAFWKRRLR
jgi:hypothetical protein